MDQLLKSLNDLHQAASSVCLHLQQIPASLTQGGRSNTFNSSTSPLALSSSSGSSIGSHSRSCSQKAGRRVHFAPPFAAVNNNFVVQGSGAAQGSGKGGKGNGKGSSSSSKQGDEDEERILISEVSSAAGPS
jgi:hypothetical protein